MRTTDFCFPLPDHEHPCLVSYRHLFEACASPLADGLAPATRRPVDLAFHDAESASVDSPGFTRSLLRLRAPDRAVPLTPPSLPGFPPRAFARNALPGSPRPLRSSLREDETTPTTRGAFHRRGTPTPTRGSLPGSCAVTCASATSSALGVPSHAALRTSLSRHPNHRALDPRPRPSFRFAMFTRSVDERFSGSDYRPTTSATALPTHGHTPEHPILVSRSNVPLSR
jgi:hypothetical protein